MEKNAAQSTNGGEGCFSYFFLWRIEYDTVGTDGGQNLLISTLVEDKDGNVVTSGEQKHTHVGNGGGERMLT